MKHILAVCLCAASSLPAGAEQRITIGSPKFEGDMVAGEGPSWDPAGYLYFVGKDRISRRDLQGKVEVFREPAGGPNGSLIDPQGRLLICEAGAR
ncbi:MAG: hypothetical protein M3Z85_00905, partial [Acidobacteriota bacterium]|nr:hypothetical protein [Acidobacteriota bacterium]